MCKGFLFLIVAYFSWGVHASSESCFTTPVAMFQPYKDDFYLAFDFSNNKVWIESINKEQVAKYPKEVCPSIKIKQLRYSVDEPQSLCVFSKMDKSVQSRLKFRVINHRNENMILMQKGTSFEVMSESKFLNGYYVDSCK